MTCAVLAVALVGLAACDTTEGPLAPFEGERPLELLAVTQSFTPEVQWVGGRVAAVGVNRGSVAALDETLVWLQTAPDNTIGSFVTVGQQTAADAIRSYGGTPLDSLVDGEEYTVWIAERSALDVGLDTTRVPAGSFADTTLTTSLVLRGISSGDRDLGVEWRIVRDERLVGSRFVVTWSPAVPFRRLAIRQASTGGFTDLVWHVLIPDGEAGGITPPVVIGETPPGAQEAVPFSGAFEPSAYTVWGVTEDWEGGFSTFSTGYSFFRVFPNNFDD
ncbi:hypothetical protein [Rubrivirga sp.]|uniref:hypothetical protein n=1 Tax=Rubrivirga sp. TaxID=1885344 RepID=UPI003B52C84B